MFVRVCRSHQGAGTCVLGHLGPLGDGLDVRALGVRLELLRLEVRLEEMTHRMTGMMTKIRTRTMRKRK